MRIGKSAISAHRPGEHVADEHDRAEHDRERVVADEPGLELAQAAADVTQADRDAVHRAVDDLAVEDVAQPVRGRGERTAHEAGEPDVEVVRVGEHLGEPAEPLLDRVLARRAEPVPVQRAPDDDADDRD